MATSPVEICNSALIKIGAQRITSFSDGSLQAKLCNEQYDKLRKETIRQHPWNFAIRRKSLAESAEEPEFEYGKAFVISSDVLRILDTNIPRGIDWVVEQNNLGQRVLLSNVSSVKIRYIKDVTDTTIFSSDFEEALALRIAADLAYALTQSSTLARDMHRAFREFLAVARSMDAQEGSLQTVEADEWIFVRS
jgi:hypothetical protein